MGGGGGRRGDGEREDRENDEQKERVQAGPWGGLCTQSGVPGCLSPRTPPSSADGDPLGQFAIIQRSEGGWGLILTQPLDREVKERHALRVMATDGKFQASVGVDIHVLDVNDNSPQCEQVREPAGRVTSLG